MKRLTMLQAVGREPFFTSGLLLSPGVGVQGVRKQLSRWTADGTVVQLRRGLYALGEPYRIVEPDPYELSNELVPGSYVSLETVLASHGLIPEAVFVTTAVTTGRTGCRTTPLGTFSYQHIKSELFWGYEPLEVGDGRTAFVATPEKALLDLGYLRSRSDDLAFTRELRLQRLDSIDLSRLDAMAKRFGGAKMARFARNVMALAATEGEEYEDL